MQARSEIRLRALDALTVRLRWQLIALSLLGSSATHVWGGGYTWHYVVSGTQELFSSRGLHLYADHPEIQMGPLTFVTAAPFVFLGRSVVARGVGMATLVAVGLLCLRQCERLAGTALPFDRQRIFLWAGVLFAPAWVEIAVHWEHPDDALALLCILLALRLALADNYILAALALGLAVDFKPWAAALIGIALIPGWQRLPIFIGTFALTVAIVWLPFLLSDPHAMRMTTFTIPNAPSSVLRVFGVSDTRTPSWCRQAQLVGGAVVTAIFVKWQRWAGVIAAAVSVRMLLDPANKNYYTGGLLLGTLLFDVAIASALIPWSTICGFVLVYVPSYAFSGFPHVQGLLTAIGLIVVISYLSFARLNVRQDLVETPPLIASTTSPRRSSRQARRATKV